MKDRQETVSSASAFVSHLNTTWVMRWLNELHTDSGMNVHTHRHTRTDRHREFCSGNVASQGTLRVL